MRINSHKQGWNDFVEGKALCLNPYKNKPAQANWALGWFCALRMSKYRNIHLLDNDQRFHILLYMNEKGKFNEGLTTIKEPFPPTGIHTYQDYEGSFKESYPYLKPNFTKTDKENQRQCRQDCEMGEYSPSPQPAAKTMAEAEARA